MMLYALGVLLGSLLQTAQAALAPPAVGWALAAAGVAGSAVLLWRPAGRAARLARAAAVLAAGAALAFGLAELRAAARLADRLDPALQGRVITVTGVVDDLPVLHAQATRFELRVLQAPPGVPQRLSLSWWAPRAKAGTPALPPPRVRPGQVWQLAVRLKRPHGLANPGGADAELTLFRQGIGATGTVSRAGDPPRLVGTETSPGIWLAALRERLRGRLLAALRGEPAAGTIAALALGDQQAIAPADWAVYRTTGVAHLMAISGLHITLLAWLAWRLADWGWRQTARLRRPWCLRLPAPTVAAWAALAVALGYALLAGWGVPAQRTVGMLAVVLLLRQRGLRVHWADALALALIAVLLADPWAVRSAGFWLSFVAVAALFAAGPRTFAQAQQDVRWSDAQRADAGSATAQAGRRGSDAAPASRVAAAVAALRQTARTLATRLAAALRDGARAQWVATLALLPLTLLFFQQIALLSPLANALAIPLVTLVVTPLAIAGLALPSPLDAAVWRLAAAAQHALDAVLRALAGWPLAQWHAAAPDALALGLAALGVAALLLPWPWRLRLPGVLLLLPLLSNPGQRPPPGQFDVWFADVGQGMAVVVRTARHTLIYDTGPSAAPGVDAGERVLLPLLHHLGERRVDEVIVSHDDGDHAGGAASLARAYPQARLRSSLPADKAAALGFAAAQPCLAGQRWDWDGVVFTLHNPQPDERGSDNARSCVLHVGTARASLLLAGDIDARRERLLAWRGELPAADLLLAPHHGSKTSSSDALLDAVMPQRVIVQAGWRNPFGHPHPSVLQRLAERGIAVSRTDFEGALHWSDAAPTVLRGWRSQQPRYWRPAPLQAAGLQFANSAVTTPAE